MTKDPWSPKFAWLIAMASLVAACGTEDASPRTGDGDVGVVDTGAGPVGASDTGGDVETRRPDAPSNGAIDGSPDAGDSGSKPDRDATGPDLGPGDDLLRVDATSATLQTDFVANISGTLGQRLGAAELIDNAGSIEVDGDVLPVFGYRVQEWADFELTLVQSIAVHDDALFPLWFYCSGSELDGVYIEGTEGTASTWIPASNGTCDVESTPATAVVELPALVIEPPAADHDFQVTGDLTISPGAAGTYAVDGRTWQTFGFETIDCTADCGTPGWWELHTLLWDAETRDLCFSIFYLYESDRDSSVAYTMCLPTMTDLVGDRVVPGDWSR